VKLSGDFQVRRADISRRLAELESQPPSNPFLSDSKVWRQCKQQLEDKLAELAREEHAFSTNALALSPVQRYSNPYVAALRPDLAAVLSRHRSYLGSPGQSNNPLPRLDGSLVDVEATICAATDSEMGALSSQSNPCGLLVDEAGEALRKRGFEDKGVDRCPLCSWELEDRVCWQCGLRFDADGEVGFMDLDSSSSSRMDLLSFEHESEDVHGLLDKVDLDYDLQGPSWIMQQFLASRIGPHTMPSPQRQRSVAEITAGDGHFLSESAVSDMPSDKLETVYDKDEDRNETDDTSKHIIWIQLEDEEELPPEARKRPILAQYIRCSLESCGRTFRRDDARLVHERRSHPEMNLRVPTKRKTSRSVLPSLSASRALQPKCLTSAPSSISRSQKAVNEDDHTKISDHSVVSRPQTYEDVSACLDTTPPSKAPYINTLQVPTCNTLNDHVKHPEPVVNISAVDYGWDDKHVILGPLDKELLEVCCVLGQGSLGLVEEVRLKDTQLPTFVRKRVKLPVSKRKSLLKIIKEEAENLKPLNHPHIVTLIGTYEEQRNHNRHFYCLLMSPVGDNELREFLEIYSDHDHSPTVKKEWEGWIRSWFVCLTSALAYMHEQGLRHQDIKPSNIIQKGSRIFFTDFSSSSTFVVGHTTSTDNPSRSSPMYAAPEVTYRSSASGDLTRHGRSSDIFALGCVFCDMLSVWQGQSLPDFHDSLSQADGATYGPFRYSDKIVMIEEKLRPSVLFPQCILPMLSSDRGLRPSAADTLERILSLAPWWDSKCDCISLR
jgi:hypothetical protein